MMRLHRDTNLRAHNDAQGQRKDTTRTEWRTRTSMAHANNKNGRTLDARAVHVGHREESQGTTTTRGMTRRNGRGSAYVVLGSIRVGKESTLQIV